MKPPMTLRHIHEHLLVFGEKLDELAHQVEDLTEAAGGWAAESKERDAKIMATLDEVLAKVTAEDAGIDSIIALVQALRDQIANAGLSPADQAKVDAIMAAVVDNPDRIDAAVNAPTP